MDKETYGKMFDLKGKVALITGSSKGIGLAIAWQMARAGASVIISSRKKDACDQVSEMMLGEGLSVKSIPCNVGVKEEVEEVDNKSTDDTDDNIMLSISEIDMLRQQLSSCWNAPAGAVIERGDKVTISAKVLQNMKVSPNSIRIVDTNIAKTNPFYGPITDSAMRTLLNPECTPLKLPKDKYNLWKNLTITFDYSIMKGY